MRIVLPFPPSVNHIYEPGNAGQWRLTARTRAWREEAIIRVRASGEKPPSGQIAVEIRVWGPAGKWDLDNIVKSIQDAVFAAIASDDSHRVVSKLTVAKMAADVDRPVVQVTLTPDLVDWAKWPEPVPILLPIEEVVKHVCAVETASPAREGA